MTRIIIDVGAERKRKMKLLVKGKNSKFKSYNELIRRLLDYYFESIELKETLSPDLSLLKGKIPSSIGKITIKITDKGASAFLNNELLIKKENIKDLIFYLWENYKEYNIEIEGLKRQDYVFSTFQDLKCWRMLLIENKKIPIVPLEIQTKNNPMKVLAYVDTASSIVILDESFRNLCKHESVEKRMIITPLGEKDLDIYLLTYNFNDISIKCETIFVKLPKIFIDLKIQALIGENLLKNKNLLVLYLRDITCISN